MTGLLWILLYQWFGTLLSQLCLPLPGPIVGMLLLLGHLQVRGEIDASLDKTASCLLHHLPLLLIPPAVGIMTQLEAFLTHGGAILAALLGSLLIGLPLTGGLLQWLMGRRH
ncbi:CidA/LrgA family protein [Halomonas koreensis]|uniref:CidA/LrgA family protein n=1 Tax=Halomonas koreensis TaxID=245385 RepID=A0ABU1G1E7_9GAMM|nr:CidA/LrgA family protein [Halomonas koreensis]MDR5866745.1 CidA/LrgA family protein [Halomonas koreensis]